MHGIAAYCNYTHYNAMAWSPTDAFYPPYTNGNARAFLDLFIGDITALYLAQPRPASADALTDLWNKLLHLFPTNARVKMIENTYGEHFAKANYNLSAQRAQKERGTVWHQACI